MANKKLIASNKAAPSRSMGPHVRQVIPSAVRHIDPFVFLDHFGPFEKKTGSQGVPPHPHAGIATITYLFSGSNRHQDSYQHDALIHAGDLAWMRAGRGIVHAEGMNQKPDIPEVVHGLQFWISLPAKDKFIEPDFFHYLSQSLPVFEAEGVQFKVICGELMGHISPVVSLSPAYIYEVKIPAGKSATVPITEGYTCGLYVMSGDITIDDNKIGGTTMARFSTAGNQISLHATSESHVMILGGAPLNEPIVAYASYVMNSEEQIVQVMLDYQAGKMGKL